MNGYIIENYTHSTASNPDPKFVAVFAGHGQNTAGKQSPDGKYKEWIGNRESARAICDKSNFVNATGNSPIEISLKSKVKFANDLKFDLALFIHSNAVFNWWTKHRGHTIFYWKWSKKSKLLAQCISDELTRQSKIPSRGIKPTLKFYVLWKTKMPAVLVERFMHTNKKDLEIGQAEIDIQANAVKCGIDKYWEAAR